MWLIAEVSPIGLETMIQLATAGGFGALAWYLIVKVIPQKDTEHRQERQSDQLRWENYLEKRDNAWRTYIEKRDIDHDKQQREWTDVMIRVEAYLLKSQRESHDGGI